MARPRRTCGRGGGVPGRGHAAGGRGPGQKRRGRPMPVTGRKADGPESKICEVDMRRAARVDDNQAEIVAALRRAGCSVCSLAGVGRGCPDLAVGLRGVTYLLEVKDGSKCPSKRRLTAGERQWHEGWRGHVAVVHSVDEALDAVGLRPAAMPPAGRP